MGGSASKPEPQDQDREPQPVSPVRVRYAISPKLLLQLAGQDLPDSSSADGRARPPNEAELAQAAVEEAVHNSRQLQAALQHSIRVGDLLLKSEDEELARVQAYAEELLNHEYRAPVKPTPCERARQACVECYTRHPEDILRCADAVNAYKACADQAIRQFIAR